MLFRLYLLPALGARKMAAVTWKDLDALHRKLAHAPYQANRLLSLASKAWALATRWGWFPRDLPTRPGAALAQEPEGAPQ